MIDIDRALADPNLLGAGMGGDMASWSAWRVILRAAYGLPLDEEQAETFHRLAGGRKAPEKPVSELWVIAGRRGGKSRIAAALASYTAVFDDHAAKLAPGETGYALVLAASKAQARAVHGYCDGFLRSSPILAQEVVAASSEEITLRGRTSIAVHSNNFRTVRGRSLICAIFDEVAYWRDAESANPDQETYRAILPALATTAGMLIGISSPYRKTGLLYQKHRDAFGQDDDDVLVIQAPTRLLNPTISEKVVERARQSDPEAAKAEWDAEFRSDLQALFDEETVEAAVDDDRPIELPPLSSVGYTAFVDASAGRHDAFTLCIGHKEDQRFVADVVRGVRAPFDPATVAGEYAELCKQYRVFSVTGDNYAGEWVAGAFNAAGIGYKRSELTRSQLYLESVPRFMRRQVSMPRHKATIRELKLLERRVAPSGKDRVDHGVGGHDDHANAFAGCLVHVLGRGTGDFYANVRGPGDPSPALLRHIFAVR